MGETLHCANHPSAETYLRCNKCDKPICTRCAVRTPVGYRCKECVRNQQKVFYQDSGPRDYLIAAGVALPLSLVAGWLVPRLGWYAIVLGPAAGSGIVQAVLWAIRRRRGEHTWLLVCGCIVAGALPGLFLSLLSSGGLAWLLWAIVYLATAVGTAYTWLRPGRRT